MKKNTKTALAIIAIIIISLIYTIPRMYVHNVFDEIYHSYISNFMTITDLGNIENANISKGDGWHTPKSLLGIYYDEDYLLDNTDVTIQMYTDEEIFDIDIMDIWLSVTFFDSDDIEPSEEGENIEWKRERMAFYCEYNIITKTLTIKPITIFSSYLDEKYPERFPEEIAFEDEASLLEFFEIHGVTKEDLDEYKDYLLNEVIIGGWVEGNKGLTRFSSEDPGDFIVIDNSYQNLGEEWQGED